MTDRYSVIEMFTSEEVRFKGKPLYEAVLARVREMNKAMRCTVTRGMAAYYENGEIATQSILALSYNLPVKIEIILPSDQLEAVLPEFEAMMTQGIMGVRDLNLVCHKTRRPLLPDHMIVADIMTPAPDKVSPESSVREVADILLGSRFTGLPVVDSEGRPVGVISRTDLLNRARLPLRFGLLAGTKREDLEAVMDSLSGMKAEKIMSRPPEIIAQNTAITEAVKVMLNKGVKRLPVVNNQGLLTGIVSRIDVFRSIAKESARREAAKPMDLSEQDTPLVEDIARRQNMTVAPDSSVEDALEMLESDDLHCVAVVDRAGRLLGLLSDQELLNAFGGYRSGLKAHLAAILLRKEKGSEYRDIVNNIKRKTVTEVMSANVRSVTEKTQLEEAIGIMTQEKLKGLPVVDAEGKYKGMVSRDALLRAGFSH